MKKGSLFAKIVYYLFTFSLGIMLAIFLPFIYMYDGEALNIIQDALEIENYTQAMSMVGGYYNTETVLNEKFASGGGIVLFESATLYDEQYGEGEEAVKEYKMHKSYSGFVYGLGSNFSVNSTVKNKTKLLINTSTGAKEFELLNSDTNNDSTLDSISSLLTNNFFFIELSDGAMEGLGVTDISSLTFILSDGSEYATVETTNSSFDSENLFKTKFFTAVEQFIAKNNELADHKALNSETDDYEEIVEKLSLELGLLDADILANEKYAKSNTSIAKSRADKKATKTVIIYFVCIYLIGDFLLGTRYILKLIKWFAVKVLKIKPRPVKVDKALFGTDYYSQVEIKLETEGFQAEDKIELTYVNEASCVTFVFNSSNGYADKQRMKAGLYTLQPSALQENYDMDLVPVNLVAEGYKKTIEMKIIRREEKRS